MSQTLSDEQFIKNPLEWPNWPYLPVIRLDDTHECGVLYSKETFIPHDGRESVKVILTNFWEYIVEGKEFPIAPVIEYPNVQEMLKEWRID